MSNRRRKWHCRWLTGAAALSLLIGAGCGGKKPYPVEGKVTWEDGSIAKELILGTVAFEMVADTLEERVTAYGVIDETGTYRLTTYKLGDGALPGKYRVIVANRAYPQSLEHERPPGPPPLDPRYSIYDTSNLTAMVEAKKNDIPLKVERNKAKNWVKPKPASF